MCCANKIFAVAISLPESKTTLPTFLRNFFQGPSYTVRIHERIFRRTPWSTESFSTFLRFRLSSGLVDCHSGTKVVYAISSILLSSDTKFTRPSRIKKCL
ncbi:hypothetical protein ACH5RR_029792 [Cinchona calisaya]|uniref:Uncharacterized protein n=1 Tax=Cinchona calisaya TaxID=153742 RepID=A0ABD2YU44_9GENT